jgi:hypothetical protein
MALLKDPDFDATSCVQLSAWRILRIARGTLHVIGHNENTSLEHVSGTIVKIDFDQRVLRARTGRNYCLTGNPSPCSATLHPVWLTWCHMKKIDWSMDITAELFANLTKYAPTETAYSAECTRTFLETLVASETPILWDLVRTHARQLLRNFPTNLDLQITSDVMPVSSSAKTHEIEEQES